jgi:hypothetical protein
LWRVRGCRAKSVDVGRAPIGAVGLKAAALT